MKIKANLENVCKADLILFTVQVTVILVVVIASLINLTYQKGDQNLWTVVLTSSLGYIMPNPKIKIEDINTDTIKRNDVNVNNVQDI